MVTCCYDVMSIINDDVTSVAVSALILKFFNSTSGFSSKTIKKSGFFVQLNVEHAQYTFLSTRHYLVQFQS